jgi:Enoyl-CoA hydratase/isomerase
MPKQGGKFMYPARLAKWLGKMRFLAEPVYHAVGRGSFIDGKLDPQLYRCEAGIAHITMDDGKVNAMSPEMMHDLNAALDRAQSDQRIVVLVAKACRRSVERD